MENNILEVRDRWAIVDITSCGLIDNGKKYRAIVGPHIKTTVSRLTMGDYQNYVHTEISIGVIGDHVRVYSSTVYNDYTSNGGSSSPYDPNKGIIGVRKEDQETVHSLIRVLLKEVMLCVQ